MTDPPLHPLPTHLDPWPHDSLERNGDTFDPDRPRYADVPVITGTPDGPQLTRGTLPEDELSLLLAVLGQHPSWPELSVGERLGVFRSPNGEQLSVVVEGDEVVLDWRIMRRVIPRDELDRLDTLEQFASASATLISRLRAWEADGWVLVGGFDLGGVDYYDTAYLRRPR